MTAADSHGVPWSGRTLTPQPFAGDIGQADAALAAALSARAAGRAGEAEVLAALARARVLVPIVATVAQARLPRDQAHPFDADAAAEMSLPLLGGPDGTRALPVFTSTATLSAWDHPSRAARPVPLEARRAALSAVDEGCRAMVLDPTSPSAFVVRRPALWALAQGRAWTPPHEDPELAAAVAAALAPVTAADRLRRAHCRQGRRAELAVVLTLEPGLDDEALGAVLREVSERLAAVPLLTERAESLELRALGSPDVGRVAEPPRFSP